jgi:hypothetical protein
MTSEQSTSGIEQRKKVRVAYELLKTVDEAPLHYIEEDGVTSARSELADALRRMDGEQLGMRPIEDRSIDTETEQGGQSDE